MIFKVKQGSSKNGYCGPAALSCITGLTVSDILDTLLRRGRHVRGMKDYEMVQALHLAGFYPQPVKTHATDERFVFPARDNWTLAQFIWRNKSRNAQDVFLLSTPSHYLVLRGRKIFDNHHPEGIFIRDYPHRRSRIIRAWFVYKTLASESSIR